MAENILGIQAKEKLERFVIECDQHLQKYWDAEIGRDFGYNSSQKKIVRKILEHANEHNMRKAKRIRAAFVYYAYMLGGNAESEKIWKAAEAVELVHTALLMHDDFMDKDLVRRGKPTTQVYFGEGDGHYGDCMAVNVGDSVLCLGFERLLDSGFDIKLVNKAMSKMLRGIANTGFGQAYDVSLPKLGELTEEKVMSLHRAKTAIYTYENPLLIGAILSEVGDWVQEVLTKYAVKGGVAFQLQDDILGVFGDEEKTGKSSNSDLLQGKVTLLAVKVMEKGTDDQRIDFLKVWGNEKAGKDDIEKAKRAIVDSGAYEYSLETARRMSEEAVNEIMALRGKGLFEPAIDFLEGIARYMVERKV